MAQLIIKTRAAIWPALRNRIVELHDDEVPEILALPVSDGLPAYARWMEEMTTEEVPALARQPMPPVGPPAAAWLDYADVYPRGQHTVSGTIKILRGLVSPQLGNRRDLLIYLPPSYDETARRYPVLYMHDGQNLFDAATSYAGEWHVDETMEMLARHGIEAIIVAVPNIGERRFQEYIPFPSPDVQGVQGDEYVSFIADTVKPIIDRDFRTRPEREATGVAGSSLGGLISLYAYFRRPEVFGLAGVFSPALRWGKRGIFPFVNRADFSPGKIYMDVGTAEGVGLAETRRGQRPLALQYLLLVRRMDEMLRRKGYRPGVSLRYVEDEGGIHHESAWARRLPDALRFLLGGSER
jgi:predicted alpha/beta superfamily hydrolase